MSIEKGAKYRYGLEEGSKKHRCPACNKKRFVRYVDHQTSEYLSKQYGRCDREINCGYFLNPYEDGFADVEAIDWRETGHQPPKSSPADYIPHEVFKASLKAYGKNRFISYLRTLFDNEIVMQLIDKYHIGSSKHWLGSTVFWQIDQQGNIRTGKVMLYDDSGHRVKKPYSHITWAHSLLFDDYNLEQCLFGEHLLTDDKSIPVAIVESEKTAIISSVYFPEFIWLATGAKSNLKPERCKSLMGCRVVLFSDLSAYNDWEKKAKELSYFCNISISDLLKTHADSEAKFEGYDLADYLIEYDITDF